MPGYIKKHVGSGLVVDAIEKSNATYRSVITFILIFFIDKSSYPACKFTVCIFQDPSYHVSMAKGLILFGIEYFVDIFIQWLYIIGILFIDLNIYAYKIGGITLRFNFNKLHAAKIMS